VTGRDRRRRIAARVVLLLSVAALGVVGLLVRSQGGTWAPTRALWLARGTGWTAVGALMISLSATPVGRLLARLRPRSRISPWLASFRRAFGIAAAILALLHAAILLGGYLRFAWAAVLSFSYMRVGLVALVILCTMLATSFPPLVQRLRVRLWKPLHRLGYLAALLVLDHLLLSPFAPRATTLALFAALFAIGLLRLLPAEGASDAAVDDV
jgi:DMSO/TMAO reductase YedYZ heme-binding membrane subunit